MARSAPLADDGEDRQGFGFALQRKGRAGLKAKLFGYLSLHPTGDQYLAHVAAVISRAARFVSSPRAP